MMQDAYAACVGEVGALWIVQGKQSEDHPGARLFCLALPGSFLTMFAQNKVDLRMYVFAKAMPTLPSY